LNTNVYIDGFNLYFAIKKTPYKWLDLCALCKKLLPSSNINSIKYFTAHIKGWPHDPSAPTRQQIYLRALRTISNLEIHDYGHFVSRPRLIPQYPLAYRNMNNPPQAVQVLKTEEKGSDVNLASFLLNDCYKKDFDEAVIISNDADLATPIKIVKTEFGKPVMIINPHRKKYLSIELLQAASSHFKTINMKVYATCQFPTILTDSQGTFSKPQLWNIQRLTA